MSQLESTTSVSPAGLQDGGKRGFRPLIRSGALARLTGRRNALIISLSLLGLLCVMFVVVPMLRDPDVVGGVFLSGPSVQHPFGTDALGRDVFARAFAAGRVDLAVAVFCVSVAALTGTVIGTVVATFAPRWVDTVVMRLIDALLAIPYLILVLLLAVIVGPGAELGPAPRGTPALIIAFLLLGWTFYARLSRSEALSIRQRDWVLAARLLGYSRPRIVLRHVATGVLRTTVAYAASDVILTMGAFASFAVIGVGVQAPQAEWGAMMVEGQTVIGTAWWVAIFPAAMLMVTGLILSVVADGLSSGASRER